MADGEVKVRNKPNKYFNSLNQQSHSLRKRLAPRLKRTNDIYITNKSDFKVCKPLHIYSTSCMYFEMLCLDGSKTLFKHQLGLVML